VDRAVRDGGAVVRPAPAGTPRPKGAKVGRLLALALLVTGCARAPFHAPHTLGGVTYSAAELNHGFVLYERGCRACHGDAGDGHGQSAQGLWPPPRDLTQGLYKFGRVPAPGLPPDSELGRIVRGGLEGTAMLHWTLADDELHDLLGYIKTFSPRWQQEIPGEAVTLAPDPFAANADDALAKGEALYHGKAVCSSCHPAYVTREKLFAISKSMGGEGFASPWSPQLYESGIKDTEYCWRWGMGTIADRTCDEPVHAIPPDFTRDPLRAVRSDQRLADLYLTLASGIAGAGMPPWKGTLTNEELWALAHYVDALVALRETAGAEALREGLHTPANVDWKP
jgi:mono/diheme cytochrome c family protein